MTRSDLRARRTPPGVVLWLVASTTAVLFFAPAARAQQELAQRIAAVAGDAELRFASRPDVCGSGNGGINFHSRNSARSTRNDRDDDWGYQCERGPVLVRLSVENGRVTRLRTHVGGRYDSSAGVTDLGTVGAREAVEYFLELARTAESRVARDAILPAALGDSVTVAPSLMDIARDGGAMPVRKQALFWAGQGGAPTPELLKMYRQLDERELKKQMIFVLSQRDDSAATDGLIDIARSDADHDLRRQAFFWLGQKDDPRVVALLTSILER